MTSFSEQLFDMSSKTVSHPPLLSETKLATREHQGTSIYHARKAASGCTARELELFRGMG